MAHSYVSVYLHIVFSTRDRMPLIPEDRQERLWAYIAGIAKNHKMKCLAANGMNDHAHLLVSANAEYGISKIVGTLKANSSRWMREEHKSFAWQEGYGAF